MNSYELSLTAPSRPRVYQFHHLGSPGLCRSGGTLTPCRTWNPRLPAFLYLDKYELAPLLYRLQPAICSYYLALSHFMSNSA